MYLYLCLCIFLWLPFCRLTSKVEDWSALKSATCWWGVCGAFWGARVEGWSSWGPCQPNTPYISLFGPHTCQPACFILTCFGFLVSSGTLWNALRNENTALFWVQVFIRCCNQLEFQRCITQICSAGLHWQQESQKSKLSCADFKWKGGGDEKKLGWCSSFDLGFQTCLQQRIWWGWSRENGSPDQLDLWWQLIRKQLSTAKSTSVSTNRVTPFKSQWH